MPAANCFFDEVTPGSRRLYLFNSLPAPYFLFVVPGHVSPFDRRLGGNRPSQWPPSPRFAPARYLPPRIGNWCRIRNADRLVDILSFSRHDVDYPFQI